MKNYFSEQQIDKYLKNGVNEVDGWLSIADKFLIWSLCNIQNAYEYSGSLGEIGVHHGKLFLLLLLNLQKGEKAFCVDVFDMQDLNIDKSGKGNEQIFLSNVDKFANRNMVHIIKDSSLNVNCSQIIEKVGKARLISIDGGHTSEITKNDLNLCEKILTDEGVIVIDDYFNAAWPGVSEGVCSYLQEYGDRLAPFAIGINKVFLCRPDLHSNYREKLKNSAREMYDWSKESFGKEVDVYNGYDSIKFAVGNSKFYLINPIIRWGGRVHFKFLNFISNQLRF